MLALLAAAIASSLVAGVPDMVTADVCLSATVGPRSSPVFSQEAFDSRARTYNLSSAETSNEIIFCREYVRTIRLLRQSNPR